jgi:NSS family neurotransmitter:Na+ symporter
LTNEFIFPTFIEIFKRIFRPMTNQREHWGSRLGLVLAAAGNAIGIGNLLRFPAQAGQNGGGAFMIPYLLSLLLFGLPLMWIAWTVGRYGGRLGHSSLPGMFEAIWKHRLAKYLGVLGVALPLVFCLYYTYIEAWCLAYAYFSLTAEYLNTPGRTVDLAVFLKEFLGDATSHSYFPSVMPALGFLMVVVLLNVWILSRGVWKGLEMLAKIAIPLLFVFCLALAIRVFTIGTIEGTVWDGLAFLWTPDFSALGNPKVWMAAAGQIFFTLGVGFGALECYASYVRKKEDVALAGLTTASTNEFVEVIFGSIIAIPAAAIFFGAGQVEEIAKSGTFSIGMVSMPEILRSTPGVHIFGTIWFLLLFFAAFTSSVAIAQPVMAFLQDEAKLSRRVAATILGLLWLLGTFPIIFFYKYGVLDEFDFWSGTIGLVVVAIIEVVLFVVVFGMKKGWDELHIGALIKVPKLFMFIMKYITPVALIAIFMGWAFQSDLTPTPKLLWNVAERETYPGKFISEPSAPLSAEEKVIQSERMEAIENKIYDAVEAVNRDLTAWTEIRLSEDGTLEVLSYSADPKLEEVFDRTALQRWLELKGFRYEEKDESGRSLAKSVTVTIGIEALNRSPYIWFARIIMLGFLVAFIAMVAILWKGRTALQEVTT